MDGGVWKCELMSRWLSVCGLLWRMVLFDWTEGAPLPPSPALLHLHWMRESLPFSPSQIVQTEDISDSTQFITFLPAFQTNTHTHKMSIASQWQPKKKKKNLKILYMQLIWKLTWLTMKYFVSLTRKGSWKKITWFFLLKTYLRSLLRDSKFVERHCSMAQGEVSMWMIAETCKREKPLIYLIRRAGLKSIRNLCWWNSLLIEVGYPRARGQQWAKQEGR